MIRHLFSVFLLQCSLHVQHTHWARQAPPSSSPTVTYKELQWRSEMKELEIWFYEGRKQRGPTWPDLPFSVFSVRRLQQNRQWPDLPLVGPTYRPWEYLLPYVTNYNGFGWVGCLPWRGTPAERPWMCSVVVQVVLGWGSAVPACSARA